MEKMIKILSTSITVLVLTISSTSHAQLGNLLNDVKVLGKKIQQQPASESNSAAQTVTSTQPSTATQQSGLIKNNTQRPPLAKANEDVTNKNLKFVLEKFDQSFTNSYWRSEDNLDIEATIVKGSPNLFRISGSQVPKGYSIIEINCSKPEYASSVHSLPKNTTKLSLFSQDWEGMIDTETTTGRPKFLINSATCSISPIFTK